MKAVQRKSTLLKKFPNFTNKRLEITEQSALRLSRLLEEYVAHLGDIERESDREFTIMWAQLFAMYGVASMASGFMVDDTQFQMEIEHYYCMGTK